MIVKKTNSIELSKQQIACLEQLANGFTYAQIAQTLILSEFTINLLISNATEKLGASSTVHAVAISIKEKLINI